jgi:acyl-coenzyme A thioesterase PaaI-like protein
MPPSIPHRCVAASWNGPILVSAEPGRMTMRIGPGEYLYNPLGSVHGGALASLLDSVMGCAVHSTLPLGRA